MSKHETPATAGFQFTVKKQVILPVIKQQDSVPLYLKFDGPMFVGKEIKGEGAKQKMEPATLANVTNLQTGELGQLIVNAVLAGTLKETYPDDGYVGRSFEIIRHPKAEGKRYHTYSLAEIEVA